MDFAVDPMTWVNYGPVFPFECCTKISLGN